MLGRENVIYPVFHTLLAVDGEICLLVFVTDRYCMESLAFIATGFIEYFPSAEFPLPVLTRSFLGFTMCS